MTPDTPLPDRRRAMPAGSRRRRKIPSQGQVISVLTVLALLATGNAISFAEEPQEEPKVRMVIVQVDGRASGVKTSGETVAQALMDAGVRIGPKDVVKPSPSTPLREGLIITVRRAVFVTVIARGQIHQLQTSATTARGVFEELGLTLDPDDEIVAGGPLRNGVRLRLIRVRKQIVKERSWFSPETLTKVDPSVPYGDHRITEGRPGLRDRTILKVYAGDRLIRTQVLREKVLVAPRAQVLRVGARPMAPSRGAWARHLNSPTPEEFKGLESMVVVATGYAPWHGQGVDGTTAIGLRAGQGVVAVDPKVIPLRSHLYIPGYGHAIAGDTGGAIKGARIDLCFNTVREAKQFGRRPVKVYVVKKYVKRSRTKAIARTKHQKTTSSSSKLTEP